MGNHYDSCRESDRERRKRSLFDSVPSDLPIQDARRNKTILDSLEEAKKLVESSTELAKNKNLAKYGIEKTTVVVYKTADGAMFFNEQDARKHVKTFNNGSGI